MTDHMTRVPIGRVCDINPESLPDSTDRDFRFHYVDLSCVQTGRIELPKETITFGEASPRARRKVQEGDVLLSTVRPNLKGFAVVEREHSSAIVSTGFAVLRAKSNTDTRYIYQVLLSDPVMKQMTDSVAGSNYPAITASIVSSLIVPLPSLPEQKAIVTILSTWDRGIRQLSDLIAAKLRSREGLIQRLLNGKFRFQEYSKSVHEQVPLNHVLEKISDPVIPSANEMYREIGVRSHGKGVFHKEPVSGESLGNKRVYRVVPGCLTVNIVFAWERAVAITTEREDGMIASHRFPMFRPNPDRLLAEYALLYLLSKKGSEALELASPGGAGRNRTLSQTGLLKNLIPLPSVPEQRRVVTFVQTADREIGLLRKQLEALKQQKKGLMQKLLTGEVRVKLPKGVV